MNIKYVVYRCDSAQGRVRKSSLLGAEKVEDAIELHKTLEDGEFIWHEIEVEYSS